MVCIYKGDVCSGGRKTPQTLRRNEIETRRLKSVENDENKICERERESKKPRKKERKKQTERK